MDAVVIRASKIHNKGVFAAKEFKEGEVVLHWDISNMLTEEEFQKLTHHERRYVTKIGDKYVLMQPPARFVNHSCEANTKVLDFCDVAIRDINKGEEITSDYEKTASEGIEMKCRCGSPNCRKIIRV